MRYKLCFGKLFKSAEEHAVYLILKVAKGNDGLISEQADMIAQGFISRLVNMEGYPHPEKLKKAYLEEYQNGKCSSEMSVRASAIKATVMPDMLHGTLVHCMAQLAKISIAEEGPRSVGVEQRYYAAAKELGYDHGYATQILEMY